MRRHKSLFTNQIIGDCISITAADMAKYPFLPQAKERIAPVEIDFQSLVELPSITERAKERVYASFELASRFSQQPSKRFDVEIASFPVAVLYVTAAKDGRLTERYALYEAEQTSKYLLSEDPKVMDKFILEMAKFFNWDIHRIESDEHTPYTHTIHFKDYLENASRGRLVHNAKWKLVNRLLNAGQVHVTRMEVCRLLQEEIKKHIEDRTEQELARIPQEIQKDVDELRAEFLKRIPHLAEFDQIVRAKESEYPPCVRRLMDRAAKGQQLSHGERFTLVTYLLHQGISVEGVVNLFSNVADFKENKTRYQVEHLAGQRGSRTAYRTYNCSTLKTHGICTDPDDSICKTIRNPLTYHLRKQGRRKEPTEE